MFGKQRLDQLLVQRGLVESREAAQKLILAGQVLIGSVPAAKAGQLVPEDSDVRILQGLKYASRGGIKLEAALDSFDLDVTGKVGLDIGASTGGFTDCLLQRNAAKVYCIDVGYGQLAWRLRHDPRVKVMERTNARYLSKQMFPETIDFAVMDVSFIGANKILEPLADITNEVILLFKPQFEAGPQDVPKGGIIRDAAIHSRVLLNFFHIGSSWNVKGLINSPILGGSGNREFLVHLSKEPGWSEEEFAEKVYELMK
ncbi:TlyA family RNA methyltransferase [bacterium]|nr:TlyA family RNA methyltransferase [bacterium]MCI0606786.1 TlyA family RNA methyltransferase [bacterium]